MMEDFGDFGDEVFLNLCAEDWLDVPAVGETLPDEQFSPENCDMEILPCGCVVWHERVFERDLCDIVRQNEEESDWSLDSDDYLDCDYGE